VDEAVIRAGFLGEAAGRDLRVTALDQQPFRRVEKRFFGLAAGG
jgi:hypothetical protein